LTFVGLVRDRRHYIPAPAAGAVAWH